MATLTSKIVLTSTDLTSNALDLTHSTTFTGSHTSGLAREEMKSISKTMRISCLDGDDATACADMDNLEGQYIDITDNHGLKKRYVLINGTDSTVGTGDIIASGSDLGTDTVANLGKLETVGGIAVDVPNATEQHAVLTLLKTAIEHVNGHNGSITVAAVSATSTGPQNITLTNAVSGESGLFTVDAKNSTMTTIIDNTYDAAATNSKDDHPLIIDKAKYTAPTIYYIKNTAAYHATDGCVFLYYDNHAGTDVMELKGGQFAYFPGSNNADLRAYTSTSGTVVEFMAIGTEA